MGVCRPQRQHLDRDSGGLTTVALTPGTRLGPYEVTALIGQGGMGEVYRAADTRLEQTVAIKVLPAPLPRTVDASQVGA